MRAKRVKGVLVNQLGQERWGESEFVNFCDTSTPALAGFKLSTCLQNSSMFNYGCLEPVAAAPTHPLKLKVIRYKLLPLLHFLFTALLYSWT